MNDIIMKYFVTHATDRIKRMQVIAIDEIIRWKHATCEPEHVLLGLLAIGDDSLRAILNERGVTPDALERVLREIMREGNAHYPVPIGPGGGVVMGPNIAVSTDVNRIYAAAIERAVNEGKEEVAPKHVLAEILALDHGIIGRAMSIAIAKETRRGR